MKISSEFLVGLSWSLLFLTTNHLMVSFNVVQASPADLQQMLMKVEQDTSNFAHEMENLILDKCNFTSDETCYKRSYHVCESELPYATCPGNEYAIKECGSAESSCGGLFDFTASVVSVAPDSSDQFSTGVEPSNERVRDGVCSTLRLEKYMIDATASSKSYWEGYDVFPPWMYYGTDDGIFRMFPGNPGKCPNGRSAYDPTVRPWFIAASSGPKDIILVLDTSGSMGNKGRISIMKEAASRVVNTLGAADFFTVIKFSTNAEIIGNDNLMVRATKENKENYERYISNLSPNGGTIFYSGFDLAFSTFEKSAREDRSSGCNRAILFLTDGILNDDASTLYNKISNERSKYVAQGQNPPAIFTYSFGAGATDLVPKEIACQNDGIWARIQDGGDLAKSMGAYYKYFAYGLGNDANENFVAWVEPYEYSIGVGMGTTASAPVFDHTVDPPVLAGVVGMDISFAALEQAFGELGSSRDEVIQQVINRSGAVCPKIRLTPCQLESLRMYGSDDAGNMGAICNKCNEAISSLKAKLCEDYSTELWDNDLNKGRNFEERSCCHVGAEPRIKNSLTDEEIKEKVCVEKSPNVALIVGLAVPGCLIALGLMFIVYRRRKKNQEKQKLEQQWSQSQIQQNIKPLENDIVVMPQPTAPEVPK